MRCNDSVALLKRAAVALVMLIMTAATALATDITIESSGQTIDDYTYWYNCTVYITGSGTVTFSDRIYVANVTINLGEGATLYASKGIDIHEGYSLTIEGNGTLIATGSDFNSGIGSPSGIPSGTINIKGGKITATGGSFAAGIGGGAEGACGEITISGGQVTANAGDCASGIGPGSDCGTSGTVTLGWTNQTDFIYASNYNNVSSISFKEGKQFYFESGGTTHLATTGNIGGKTIRPAYSNNLNVATISGIKSQYLYTGNEIALSPIVHDANGNLLVKGTHYEVSSSPSTIKDTGEYSLTITPVQDGGYIGSKTITFSIIQFDMADAVVSGIRSYYLYTGNSIDLNYTVKGFEGVELTKNVDYTASIDNVQDQGNYTLTLTPASIGYTGSKSIDITVGTGIPLESTSESVTLTSVHRVTGNITIDGYIPINGDVILVLDKDATLNAKKGILVFGDCKLTIMGEGTLNATGDNNGAGIEIYSNSTLVVEGGIINATGGNRGAGIGGGCSNSIWETGTVIINGGTVNATGGQYAAGIGGGGINYNNVNPGVCGTIIINGGKVTANGGYGAPGIGARNGAPIEGSLTLGWTNQDDFIYASSYENIASISFATGKHFYFNDNGATQVATSDNIGGKTLYPLLGDNSDNIEYTTISGIEPYYLYDGNEISIDYIVRDIDGNTLFIGTHFEAEFSSYPIRDKGDYTLTLTAIDGSSYTGSKVIPFTVGDGIPVTDGTTVMNALYYHVSSNVTVDDRINIIGDVTLILDEGKKLIASKGIELSAGNKLTINGRGILEATTGELYKSGIGSKEVGTLVINGLVKAKGGENGAGIGGDVNNTSGGTIIINSGEVLAIGGMFAAGIGSGGGGVCGIVTINGGRVVAEGGNYSGVTPAGIGACPLLNDKKSGTVTLGWTTVDDSYIVSNFNYVETLRIAQGKPFTASTGKIYTGVLDDDQRAEIAGQRLLPVLYSGITLTKEGYSTYYNSQADAVLPAGMKARIITAKGDGQTLTYETVADGDLTAAATATVPAGTAVMLQVAPAGATQSFDLGLTSPVLAAISETNLLHGSDAAVETSVPGGGSYSFYKLSYNTGGTDLGWYWGAQNGAKFTSTAHKAWLALPSSGQQAPVRSIGLPGFNETTTDVLIIPYQPDQPDDAWYDLLGRKLDKAPTTEGLYIRGGHKIMIK